MTAVNWGPDSNPDPHTNADAFVYNPDNGDTSKHKLPAWRVAWDMPELTKLTAAAAAELDTEKRWDYTPTCRGN